RSSVPVLDMLLSLTPKEKGGRMLWRTHVLGGLSSLWLLTLVPNLVQSDTLPLLAVAASFGALLPDLDAEQSKLRSLSLAGVQPFALPSTAIHRTFGHRGLLHSLLGLAGVGLLSVGLSFWWGGLPSLSLSLGYASHLLLDACTRSGVPLFYPNKRRFHL